jgi:alkylation response protein AidB-like acyl-CoA dehydrogenase
MLGFAVAYLDEGERERRLPVQVLAAMHEARLFRMYIPKALDGLQLDPITSMIVGEEIARADAAAAWNLMPAPPRDCTLWS